MQPAGQNPEALLTPGTVTVPLSSHTNASPFWIMLLLVEGSLGQGIIRIPVLLPQAGRHLALVDERAWGHKKEDVMTSKVIGLIVALVLVYSAATAADIRRVVTALDGNDKAIVLFDSRVTLEPGNAPSAKLWFMDTALAGLSFADDGGAKPTALLPDLGTALLVVELPPLDPTEEAKMDPTS